MVLINLGASHNFINVGFAEKKNLKTKGFEGFKVSNANGKLTLVDHIVEIFGVRLHIYTVRENFYIYPLKVHTHIILGVQWLFDLGYTHTNYQKFTMSFKIYLVKFGRQCVGKNWLGFNAFPFEMVRGIMLNNILEVGYYVLKLLLFNFRWRLRNNGLFF